MIWQWIVVGAGFLALAFYAQYQRILAEKLAGSLLAAHAWVDEIITALENKDEEEGNRSIGRLVAEQRDDEWTGSSVDQGMER